MYTAAEPRLLHKQIFLPADLDRLAGLPAREAREGECACILEHAKNYYIADGIKRFLPQNNHNRKATTLSGAIPAFIEDCRDMSPQKFSVYYIQKRLRINSFRKLSILENLVYYSFEKKHSLSANGLLNRSERDIRILDQLSRLNEANLLFLHEKIDSIKSLKFLANIPVSIISAFVRQLHGKKSLTQSDICRMGGLVERATYTNKTELLRLFDPSVHAVDKDKKLFEDQIYSCAYPKHARLEKNYIDLCNKFKKREKGCSIEIMPDPLLESENLDIKVRLRNTHDIEPVCRMLQDRKQIIDKIQKITAGDRH